jgi:hypothetical protein
MYTWDAVGMSDRTARSFEPALWLAFFDSRYLSAAIWSASPCCSTDPESPLAFRGPAAFSRIVSSRSSAISELLPSPLYICSSGQSVPPGAPGGNLAAARRCLLAHLHLRVAGICRERDLPEWISLQMWNVRRRAELLLAGQNASPAVSALANA